MGIFDKRETVKPYEYPQLEKYAEAILDNFWQVKHFEYDQDLRDYKKELTEVEKSAVERCMLAISVVENKVKTFWARIDQRMPKTEIADVGHVFAGNEVVHRKTYEKLLENLGLDKRFEKILEVPCMKGRVDYLNKYLSGVNSRSNKEFTKSLILFALLVENCSLFSQFLIMTSFRKYRQVFNTFKNIVNATAREEILHGKFGAELVNIIRNENPDWFDDDMEAKIRRGVRKAFEAETQVLEWIFEKGELDWISKEEILEFLKNRLNNSLNQMNYENEYEINEELLEKSNYMEVMLLATADFDFFVSKTTDYDKSKSYTVSSLWD